MGKDKINRIIGIIKSNFTPFFAISLGVVLFLLFFQPFSPGGLTINNFEAKLLFMSGFGLMVFILLFVRLIIPANIFTDIEEQDQENTTMAYLADFLLATSITLGFVFYLRYVGNLDITFFIVVKIAVIALFVPIVRNLRLRMFLTQKQNKQLREKISILEKKVSQYAETYADAPVELHSEYSADIFRVQANQIIYVLSADNYVEVGYLHEDEFKKKLIRNTLKNIENQLVNFQGFIRTHRTSIVNMQYVDELKKKNNKYWLSLSVSAQTIPVARQYLMVVKELL